MLDSKLEGEKKVPQKHQYCHLQVVGPPTRKKVTLPPSQDTIMSLHQCMARSRLR